MIHVKCCPRYHNMARPQVCGWNGQFPDEKGSCDCVEYALENYSGLRYGRAANSPSLHATRLRIVKRFLARNDSYARRRKQKKELRFYLTYGARVWNGLKWLRMSLAVPREHVNDLVPNQEGDF